MNHILLHICDVAILKAKQKVIQDIIDNKIDDDLYYVNEGILTDVTKNVLNAYFLEDEHYKISDYEIYQIRKYLENNLIVKDNFIFEDNGFFHYKIDIKVKKIK